MGETMKFCYVDESGSQNDRFLVMAGIIVDATRMHVTKGIWVDFLDLISEAAGRRIEEFHTRDLYSGSGPWHKVDGHPFFVVVSINHCRLRTKLDDVFYQRPI